MWQQWVNGILGLYLILVPFLGLSGSGVTSNVIIVGVLVALLGFWGAAAKKGA